jgi:hypothetical protein
VILGVGADGREVLADADADEVWEAQEAAGFKRRERARGPSRGFVSCAPKAMAKKQRARGGGAQAARESAGVPDLLSADEIEKALARQAKWGVAVCGDVIPWEETPLGAPGAPAAAAALARGVEFFESATVAIAPPPGAGGGEDEEPRRIVLAVGAAALVTWERGDLGEAGGVWDGIAVARVLAIYRDADGLIWFLPQWGLGAPLESAV